MTEAEQIAEFLRRKGPTKCPPRWVAETSNAVEARAVAQPERHVSPRRRRSLGKQRRQQWAYRI